MPVPITKFRKEIFALADAALKGKLVEFIHRGVTFKLVPEQTADKLKNITALQIVNPKFPDLKSADAALRSEMQREWEKDWKRI